MRNPLDNGLSLFDGKFTLTAALAPPGNPPPKMPRGRPPGNGDLGKPVGPIGPGLGGKFKQSAATKNGKPIA